ncbi:MAG: response regulator transcription factor [Chloroflexi bacterium]|nr:MAG: response regulator transcription factor [Chloroflexota bacterium]TMF01429.1 MAG: response regulator transcription factor [Chloroflexota bacterium]
MRVVIAEDSALFREGLARLLEGAGCEVAGRAADGRELVKLVEASVPDIVVTDIRMPPTHTIEGLVAAAEIRDRHPEVAVLLLSQYVETTHALKLLERGGDGVGYLLKDRVSDVRQFVEAVRRVAAGGSVIDPEVVSQLFARKRRKDLVDELTERERETLRLMAEGRSNSAIASSLHMSEKTVEGHVRSIFSKLQLEPAAEDHRRVLAVLTYLKA